MCRVGYSQDQPASASGNKRWNAGVIVGTSEIPGA